MGGFGRAPLATGNSPLSSLRISENCLCWHGTASFGKSSYEEEQEEEEEEKEKAHKKEHEQQQKDRTMRSTEQKRRGGLRSAKQHREICFPEATGQLRKQGTMRKTATFDEQVESNGLSLASNSPHGKASAPLILTRRPAGGSWSLFRPSSRSPTCRHAGPGQALLHGGRGRGGENQGGKQRAEGE
ncbi:unnamed protein product [Prorocentrum cordatum]|uniref:Uncharacterized protein n=2 Tax=Prorocentrum cordatum TaxID=2364126 RepID=A0ABN9UC95_9DINO|nr:unnamed protein product [Polarella glacialis]